MLESVKGFETRYINHGDSCILMVLGNEISLPVHRRVKNLYSWLNGQPLPGVEVVCAYCTISVYYNPLLISPERIVEWLKEADNNDFPDTGAGETRKLHIPVCFGGDFGPDLGHVAKHLKMTEEEVISIFTSHDYLNYFIGFMPGKPYLGGLPKVLETPRLDTPRVKLPSGTVAILGKQAALFGIEQPSGANCLGRSPVRIYDARKTEPIMLKIGDLLHFYPISMDEYKSIYEKVEMMTYDVRIEHLKGE